MVRGGWRSARHKISCSNHIVVVAASSRRHGSGEAIPAKAEVVGLLMAMLSDEEPLEV